MIRLAAAVLALAAFPGSAGAEPVALARVHWATLGNSLLHYGADGSVDAEVGLGRWEETGVSRQIRAGVSPTGNFAWTMEIVYTWNVMHTRAVDSKRLLHFYGAQGLELWSEPDAQYPEQGLPLVFSDDGETLVVAVHPAKGWLASIRDYTGNVLAELGPFQRLQKIAISANGRFSLAQWLVTDQSATHSVYDRIFKKRQDIPSQSFYLGPARLTSEGKIFSGPKLVFDFSPPTASTAAVESPGGLMPARKSPRRHLPAAAPGTTVWVVSPEGIQISSSPALPVSTSPLVEVSSGPLVPPSLAPAVSVSTAEALPISSETFRPASP